MRRSAPSDDEHRDARHRTVELLDPGKEPRSLLRFTPRSGRAVGDAPTDERPARRASTAAHRSGVDLPRRSTSTTHVVRGRGRPDRGRDRVRRRPGDRGGDRAVPWSQPWNRRSTSSPVRSRTWCTTSVVSCSTQSCPTSIGSACLRRSPVSCSTGSSQQLDRALSGPPGGGGRRRAPDGGRRRTQNIGGLRSTNVAEFTLQSIERRLTPDCGQRSWSTSFPGPDRDRRTGRRGGLR